MMKIPLMFSIAFTICTECVCQKTTIVDLPVFENGKTYNEIVFDDKLIDEVVWNYNAVFLKIQLGNNVEGEYYYCGNDAFYFRKIRSGLVLEEGLLKMNMQESVYSDTTITIDPVTFESSTYIYSVRNVEKDGKWEETTSSGQKATGEYTEGLKEGSWNFRDARSNTVIFYRKGEVVKDTILLNRKQ
jgi:hypothetical protein